MSKVQTVRGLIIQRLSAAAEEIFELFERTIAEYEEQLCRSKEENQRQQKLLEAVYNPEVRLHRADSQQLLVSVEEVPPDQQERSASLDQEENPEPPHIKEEQEELRSSQDREQLQGREEEDLTPDLKSVEDDGEEPQSSQPDETQTEEDRETEGLGTSVEDCGDSEPDCHSPPVTDGEMSHSDAETRGCDSGEMSDAQFSSNHLQNKEARVSGKKLKTKKKRSVTSSECASSSAQKDRAQKRSKVQKDEKPFTCSDCGETFHKKKDLSVHEICHTKTYNCTFCEKFFLVRLELERHLRSHTGEKPYSCSVCGKRFTQSSNLYRHQKIHTREKPYSCSICVASFRQKTHLDRHIRTHTGERPYSCSVCRKTFSERGTLQRHSTVHTKEKLYTCSSCDKVFTRQFSLVRHKC
ncbi:uncharacterized protein LOC141802545 isoform X2 [Halichoeres trimaculatus]|uniref:uncharacterized protein LOC141802545 isoform X2 n=1 Tax=Halichoeres trimaculatus TaxID=147232 RepID=UPI003D9DEB79